MNKNSYIILTIFLIIISLIIETTIINFPFIFIFCATLLVLVKRTYMSIGAVICGILIDSLRISGFGLTPLFLIGTILLILLYEKYSGSRDLLLAGVIIGLFAFVYTHLLHYSLTLTVGFIIISFVSWQMLRILQRRSLIGV